jgi:NitT/TauT family transport system substrate-binding protein
MKRLVVLALMLLTAMPAWANDAVSFRLNFLVYGFHTPFYLGVDRGYYRNHGIDLTIGEGQGSGRAVQIVASGSEQFGLADGGSIINGVVKGAPVIAVMGIMNRSPYGISIRQDSGITDLKGLAGKTLAATTGEAGLTIFPAILKRNGMAPDCVWMGRRSWSPSCRTASSACCQGLKIRPSSCRAKACRSPPCPIPIWA